MKGFLSVWTIAGVIACASGCSDKPTVIMPTATGEPKPVGESGGSGAGKKEKVAGEKVEAPSR